MIAALDAILTLAAAPAPPGLEQTQWLWARPTWLIIGLLLLPPAAWLITRRQNRAAAELSPLLRRTLIVCRIAILLILVVILGGPFLRTENTDSRPALVAVLIDDSQSMHLPTGLYADPLNSVIARQADLTPDPDSTPIVLNPADDRNAQDAAAPPLLSTVPRHELARRAVDRLLPAWRSALGDNAEVKLIRFAADASDLPENAAAGDPSAEPDTAPDRSATNLAAALEHTASLAADRNLAAIVVLTDGRNNAGPDPAQQLQRLMASPDSSSAPPVTLIVPVGGTQPTPDLALLEATAPAEATLGDTVPVLATLRLTDPSATPPTPRTVTVTLLADGRPVDSAEVTLTPGESRQITLNHKADSAGLVALSVQAAAQPVETRSNRDRGDRSAPPRLFDAITENNSRSTAVRISPDRIRLLHLEGYPRWDFRFLDHATRRDTGLSVTLVMEAALRADGILPADLPIAAALPDSVEAYENYDLILLGDVSPDLLPPVHQQRLADAIERFGIGLIVAAGPQTMPARFADQPLLDLLPVAFTTPPTHPKPLSTDADAPPSAATDPYSLSAPAYAPFKFDLTPAGSRHPAFSVHGDPQRDRRLFASMPPFYWASYPAAAKPAAATLAELITLETRRPLIAEQYHGRGRVLFIGHDSTFLFRRNIGDPIFYRFWGQAFRHVARRPDRPADKPWIEPQPWRLETGSESAIELFVPEPSRQGGAPSLTVTGPDPDSPTAQLPMTPTGQEGRYRALLRPASPGLYNLRYHDPARPDVPITAQLIALGNEPELAEPDVDRNRLQSLADSTGSRMVELPGLTELPDRVTPRPVTQTLRTEAELWDNAWTLILLVTLYCIDLAIRRITGLA